MSVETPGGDTEAKLKELIESVEYADRHTEDIAGFVHTCGAAASFLSECKDKSVHWFCEPRTAILGERSILGFSYENGRTVYAARLTEMLDRCPNCARGYHFALEDVKKSMSRVNIPAGNMVPMFELVWKFNEERLMDRLNKVVAHKQSNPDATYHSLPIEMRSAVYESLYVADMSEGGALWGLFVRVVELLDTNHDLFGVDQIAPALFFALFGTSSDMHKRARKALDVVDADSVSTLHKLNCKALLSVSKNCCSSRESKERLLYWYNTDCVFAKLSGEAILSEFRQDDDDFVSRLLHDILASPNIPLHGLLKFLGTLVTKLGSKFSTILPFKSKILVSTVLDNPNFYHRLPLSGPIDPTYDTDFALRQEYLLDWIPPLVKTQADEASDLTQLGESVFSGLLQLTKSLPAQDANARNFVLSYALESVAHCFQFKPPTSESKLPLLEPVARIQRAGLKELIYNNRMVIIDNLRSPRKRLADAALKCLQLSIEFDVISALPDSTSSRVEITDQSVIAEISRSFPPSLWGELNKNPRVFDAKVVSTVLHAMKYAGFIAQPPVKKVTNYLPKKELSQQALLCSIESLRNISDMDGRILKGVITNRDVLVCLFLNLFSANADQNRAAVDLICQSFDSDAVNRLTAITSLFMHDLKVSLSAFCDAIDLVKQLQLFAPCSQLTKVAQDVSTTLYDTRKGVVDTAKKDQFSQGKENELFRYWNTNWEFLRFSFHKTYAWSNQFKAEFMLEFMKDQLDYCKTLLDTFRLVEADLPPPTGSHTNGELLSLPAINTIDPLCQLLRLKDEALVYSSFQNIMTIIDLMKSFKVQFPKRVTDQFVKLAKQEISNIMPREQTSGLLAATGVFSNDEIDEILSKVGFDQSPSATPPPSNGSDKTTPQDSRTSTPPTATAAASRPSPAPGSYAAAAAAANKKPGQQRSINEFMRTSSGPAPPPPPPKAPEAQRTTAMDAVRAELMSQKSASGMVASSNRSSQPPKEIHPPRPAGFNSARAKRLQANEETVSRTMNQKAVAATEISSESDDSDDEDGLFTDKKAPTAKPGTIRNINKPTVTPIGMDRRPRVTTLSEKEREERNMRARLNIDTSPLYRRVLSWDYHSNSEYPDANRKYEKVMPSFKSVEQYQKTFEPLLLLECWQGIQKAKEESAAQETPFKLVVGNRITCDDFIDVYASVETSVLSKVKLTDSDLIVLTYFDDPDSDAKRPSKERPYCLAKIRELKPNYSADYADLMLRTYNPKTMLAHLSSKTILHGLRVMSMTTLEREFCSLKGLPFYDLGTAIYKGDPSRPAPVNPDKISQVMKTYNVNESQARAISSTIMTRGFSLIQGPPGTGKTKTILGIIGAFLSSTATAASSAPVNGVATAIEAGKQVLVCAPSNAAVDELVLRLKQGVISSHGRRIEPSVVRLGRSEAINNSVKELTLEELADRAVAEVERTAMEQPNKELREEQTQTVNRRNELRKELEGHDGNGKKLSAEEYNQKDEELRSLNRKIKELGHQLDMQRERVQSAVRKRESERRKIQSEILHKAQVICATLSGSSHTVLSSLQMKFDTVIIDEAAQCIELSALIPLKYGCKQCVMVGDPNQLPPTVLSQAAANLHYEQSLFVRMFNRFRDCVHMLNMQFRMHPAISKFPSKEFYQGKLLDGPRMAELTARPWHSKLFPPYKFFDVRGGQHKQAKETRSLFNRREAEIALEIFSNLIAYDPNLKADQIGVISTYKRQVQVIKDLFRKELGDSIVDRIDFNTIDGFQGQEKDVIILSCVRAQPDAKGVGFLSDTRRMNVAITRARSSLWILGNQQNLVKNPVWARLISDAKARRMFQAAVPGFMDKALKDGSNGALSPDAANSGGSKRESEDKDDDEIQEIFAYSKGPQPGPPSSDSKATTELPPRPQKRPSEGSDLPNPKRVELSKAEPSDPRAALLGGTIPSPLPHVASPSPAAPEGNPPHPTKNGENNNNPNHHGPRPSKKPDYQQYRPNRDKYDQYRPNQHPKKSRVNNLGPRLPGSPHKGQNRGGGNSGNNNNNGPGAPQQPPIKKRKKKPASVFVNNRKPLPPKEND